MQNKGIILANVASTVADQAAVEWPGGRACLVILATTYPTTVSFQILGPDGLTWINMNASNITANSCTAYDCPRGQYRIHLASGTVSKLFANLVSVPYG